MNQPLVTKLSIILENSEEDSDWFYWREESDFISGMWMEQSSDVCDDLSTIRFQNRHVELLRKLYFQSNPDAQSEITRELASTICSNGARGVGRVAAFTLLKTGQFDVLLNTLETWVPERLDTFLGSLEALSLFISYNWNQITTEQLSKLYGWSKTQISGQGNLGAAIVWSRSEYTNEDRVLRDIKRQVNELLTREIEAEIESNFNPEINQDKVRLQEEITKFHFPQDLSQTLDKIDALLGGAQDAFDHKATMDLIRAFTERLYRVVLDTYGEKGRAVSEISSEKVAKFLVKEGLISGEFGTILANMRHFLSNQASHRLKSRPEDARLCRNITIELSLYLLNRLESH